MSRAKASTAKKTVHARDSNAPTRISAPRDDDASSIRDEELDRVWKIYTRHRERISRSTFARCDADSGFREFVERGVRVSESSVAERALSAEVETLEED